MTIDSNIIIAYLDGDKEVREWIMNQRKLGVMLYLSTVVETEIMSFSSWTIEEQEQTEIFLKKIKGL